MKDFILTYFKEIILIAFALIELLLLLLSIFKKEKKGTTLYADILMALPDIINMVETSIGCGKGETKLKAVFDAVKNIIVKETGSVPTRSDLAFIRDSVERILSTPQKKEK